MSLLRTAFTRGFLVTRPIRLMSTTASVNNMRTEKMAPSVIIPDHPEFVISDARKDFFYPHLGNRDIVGYGCSGEPEYVDDPQVPAPAIRFQPNTPEFMALREKEKGDWKLLTIDEKKRLYRFNFCRTYAEMHAPTGLWRSYLAAIFTVLGMTLLFETFVLNHMMHGYTDESKINRAAWDPDVIATQLERIIVLRGNPISGAASKFDYEKNEWK